MYILVDHQRQQQGQESDNFSRIGGGDVKSSLKLTGNGKGVTVLNNVTRLPCQAKPMAQKEA